MDNTIGAEEAKKGIAWFCHCYDTYRSAINYRVGAAPSLPQHAVPAWQLLAVSSVFLIISEIFGIACLGQLNTLSLLDPVQISNPSSVLFMLKSTIEEAFDGLVVHHTINKSITIIAFASLVCYFFSWIMAGVIYRSEKGKQGALAHSIDYLYLAAALHIECTLTWLTLSILALVIGNFALPTGFLLHHRNATGFIFTIGAASVFSIEFLKFFWFRRKAGLPLKSIPSKILAPLFVAAVCPLLLLEITLPADSLFPSSVTITMSPSCSKEGCYAYVRSQYTRPIYLDSTIIIPITDAPLGALSNEKRVGMLEIEIVSLKEKEPYLSEPGEEQLVKISSATFRCDKPRSLDIGVMRAFGKPVTIGHILNQEPSHSQLTLNTNIAGTLFYLLRNESLVQKENCT
ncbi:MAG TPA: hypothetical protein VGC69_13920 [Bordetella sp.]